LKIRYQIYIKMDGHLEEALVDDTNEFVLNILVYNSILSNCS
jgi:hypothetical protein